MLRILYINYSNDIGGAEKSLLSIFSHINKDKFRPFLLTFGKGRLTKQAKEQKIETVEVPLSIDLSIFRRERLFINIILGVGKLPALAKAIFLVRRAIKSRNIDIIHTNNPKSHLIGSFASIGLVNKTVFHMRDIFKKRSLPYFMLYLFGKFFRPEVISISKAVKNSLPLLLKEKTIIINNGFSLPVIKKDKKKIREEMQIGESEKVIITVGRIVPWKGHKILIEAMSPILKDENVKLIIVGDVIYWDENYLLELKNLARSLGIFDKIIFTGFLDDIANIISASDLFVLASENEPFGRVLVEAMMCGLPVISFNCGGPTEIIENNVTGLLIKYGDKERLTEAIRYLLLDNEIRLKMGQKARQHTIKNYPLEKMINSIEKFYSEII